MASPANGNLSSSAPICRFESRSIRGATRPPDVALPNRRFRARVDSRRPLKMHDHADVRKFDSVHRASANAPSMTGRRGGSATPRMQINLECGCGHASGVRHFRGPRDRTRHSNATLLADLRGRLSNPEAVSYTHLRAHETRHDLVCRL